MRWLIRCDLFEVLNIEQKSFKFPWCKENFLYYLRQRNYIGMVAVYNNRVVGYMIYELYKQKLHVANFAVDPKFHRHAVGKQMVEKLMDKLSQHRRQEITLEIRETNLGAQLFFKKMGFKAMLVLRNYYDDTNEDAYFMRYALEGAGEYESPYAPKNRISGWDVLWQHNKPKNRITAYFNADADVA